MNSFIEDVYYSNIDPQAKSSEQNKKGCDMRIT